MPIISAVDQAHGRLKSRAYGTVTVEDVSDDLEKRAGFSYPELFLRLQTIVASRACFSIAG